MNQAVLFWKPLCNLFKTCMS